MVGWEEDRFVFLKNGVPAKPLSYTSGKTQEDVYYELSEALKRYDVVFYKSQPGTGKTVVLLNLARKYGGAVFATVTNVLSEQYSADYERAIPGVSIGYMKGRANFDCLYVDGVSCNHKSLPCTRRLRSKERRKDVGAECPHFAYICGDVLGEEEEYAEVYPGNTSYDALDNSRYGVINWGRKPPCGFYKQFDYYASKNVVSLNFALFRLETISGRLPKRRLVVIDEGDEFLSSLTLKTTITDRRMKMLENEGYSIAEELSERENKALEKMYNELAENYQIVKQEEGFFSLTESPVVEFYTSLVNYLKKLDTDRARGLLSQLLWLGEFPSTVVLVESYETSQGVSKRVTFCVPEPGVVLMEMLEKLGVGAGVKVVFSSATFQSHEVLRDMYKLKNYGYVVGEVRAKGTIVPRVVLRWAVEMNHENWEQENFRKYYYASFLRLLNRVERPAVVLVHSYKYLPEGVEVSEDGDVLRFKRGEIDLIISAKIRRGVDFPNAKGLLFQRYPYPDMQSPEIQILRHKLDEETFWRYYEDRALREFIQGVGRCTRGEDQRVVVYSPDIKCFDVLTQLRDIFTIEEE